MSPEIIRDPKGAVPMPESIHPYRVFVSYSHEDAELAKNVRRHLKSIGARPMSDQNNRVGVPFDNDIARQISFAHVFVSILTDNSAPRPWVHQELGYAMAMGIPFIPLALDKLPEGMAERIQAMRVNSDLSDLEDKLTAEKIEDTIASVQEKSPAMFRCGDRLYERTRILVECAKEVARFKSDLKIRQRMAFSSFSLPDEDIRHQDWDIREGNSTRSQEVRKKLLEERDVMIEYATKDGCDLILDPYVKIEKHNSPNERMQLKHAPAATAVRVKWLLEFLENMTDDKAQVVIQKGCVDDSLCIVGDLFAAEAVVPHYKEGYKKTMFTNHAPTVLNRIRDFDRQFARLLKASSPGGQSSRIVAIEKLKALLQQCNENS
jgi:hypothetical protein